MLRTSGPASHRFGRLAAGLSIAAVTAAGTVLTATPAHAQTSVTAVVLAFDELRINGTESNDAIEVSGVGPFFVSNSKGSVQAGNGCVPDGSRARCDRVKSIQVFARGGDDSVRNPTAVPSFLFGGGGNDQLAGGFGKDFIEGNRGDDVVNGRSGFDTCSGESELNCEK